MNEIDPSDVQISLYNLAPFEDVPLVVENAVGGMVPG